MESLKIDISGTKQFIEKDFLSDVTKEVLKSHEILTGRKGRGNDFLGWLDLPSSFPEDLVKRITADAEKIKKQSEIVIVIGIGGSYLGARAVIDALSNPFRQLEKNPKFPLVVYAGENLSEDYHKSLLDILETRNYSLIVISKSGTTTEPAVAFRLLKDHLEKKFGQKNAAERIYVITDASKGALKKLADQKGYPSYIIPDDVGGRYSVLTPVGLLPIAVSGFDIRKLLGGAREMMEICTDLKNPDENPAVVYAAVRNALCRKGKTTEMLVSFEPELFYLIEWWKQLYGESEGKENKGIFPAGAGFTTDLHSMGQFIQEGSRIIFETVLSVENARKDLRIPDAEGDPDGLNFIAGRRLSAINRMAELGTRLAHIDGGVPNIRLIVPRLNEAMLGQIIYFFEFACALSGYTLGVNPFDQPGVEAYKKNMFALLGKPGYEKEGEELKKRITNNE